MPGEYDVALAATRVVGFDRCASVLRGDLCILGGLAHTKARAIISRGCRSETDPQIIAQAYPEIGGHIGTSAMDWISA